MSNMEISIGLRWETRPDLAGLTFRKIRMFELQQWSQSGMSKVRSASFKQSTNRDLLMLG